MFVIAGVLALPVLQNAEAASTEGSAVFTRNCSVCHTFNPPPKTAPPIGPIAGQYHRKFTSKAEGVDYMVNFLKTPSKEKSIMPAGAIERFGLMPPMAGLSEEDLKAVAGWVWDQPWGGTGQGTGKSKKQQGTGIASKHSFTGYNRKSPELCPGS